MKPRQQNDKSFPPGASLPTEYSSGYSRPTGYSAQQQMNPQQNQLYYQQWAAYNASQGVAYQSNYDQMVNFYSEAPAPLPEPSLKTPSYSEIVQSQKTKPSWKGNKAAVPPPPSLVPAKSASRFGQQGSSGYSSNPISAKLSSVHIGSRNARPSYTAVAKKSIAQNKPPANQSHHSNTSKASSDEWPAPLTDFVSRIFANCPPHLRDVAEKNLKEKIVCATEQKMLWTINWSSLGLNEYHSLM